MPGTLSNQSIIVRIVIKSYLLPVLKGGFPLIRGGLGLHFPELGI